MHTALDVSEGREVLPKLTQAHPGNHYRAPSDFKKVFGILRSIRKIGTMRLVYQIERAEG